MSGQRKRALAKAAKECGIFIPGELEYGVVRGIYQFFTRKESGEKHCFYVGRSADISKRIYEHISKSGCLVFKLIQKYKTEGNIITIEIEEVKYKGENYYRDMQRLAYAEYKCIEKHQRNGDCLNQIPEGTRMSKKTWEEQTKDKRSG